jgi:hypothetical protein
MKFSEPVVAEELERVISSIALRVEQQRIHVKESSGSSAQAATAQRDLDGMLQGLQQLRSRRAYLV